MRNKLLKITRAIVGGFIACGCISGAVAAISGTGTDVGNLANPYSDGEAVAMSMSAAGRVVGYSEIQPPNETRHAFRSRPYTALDPSSPNQRDNLHGTLVSTLADPCDCTVTASAAFDILEESSGAIDIVGQLQRDNGAWVPFWYSEVTGGSVSIHLINMGTYGTSGNAIRMKARTSGGATVVGHIMVSGKAHAAYWESDNTTDYLYDHGGSYFPSTDSYFTDCDGSWQRIVGYYNSSGSWHGFFVDHPYSGNWMSMPEPSGIYQSFPLAMNTSGRIVGYGINGSGVTVGLVWQYNSSTHTFTVSTLSALSGTSYTIARGVASDGTIVGSGAGNLMGERVSTDEHAVLWNSSTLSASEIVYGNNSVNPSDYHFRPTRMPTPYRVSMTANYFGPMHAFAFQLPD